MQPNINKSLGEQRDDRKYKHVAVTSKNTTSSRIVARQQTKEKMKKWHQRALEDTTNVKTEASTLNKEQTPTSKIAKVNAARYFVKSKAMTRQLKRGKIRNNLGNSQTHNTKASCPLPGMEDAFSIVSRTKDSLNNKTAGKKQEEQLEAIEYAPLDIDFDKSYCLDANDTSALNADLVANSETWLMLPACVSPPTPIVTHQHSLLFSEVDFSLPSELECTLESGTNLFDVTDSLDFLQEFEDIGPSVLCHGKSYYDDDSSDELGITFDDLIELLDVHSAPNSHCDSTINPHLLNH